MIRLAVLFVFFFASFSQGVTLHSEALSFLERLYSRGYTGTGLVELQLELLRPCTISVYPPANSAYEGFYVGLGGNNILDLGLRLEGEEWFLEDGTMDDCPVLVVDSSEIVQGTKLVVCAEDMIRGARSDSAIVLWAFAPVDRGP